MADCFGGFLSEGIELLAGLAADNSRTFFDTHRRTNERDLAAPVRLFVTAVADQLRESGALRVPWRTRHR